MRIFEKKFQLCLSTIIAFSFFTLPSSLFAMDVISNVDVNGCCIVQKGETVFEKEMSCKTSELKSTASTESGVFAAIGTAALTAIIEGGVDAFSKIIQSYRKSFDGKASGQELIGNLLSCGDGKKGHHKELAFSLMHVDEDIAKDSNEIVLKEGKEFFRLTGELSLFNDPFDNTSRSLMFNPKKLEFKEAIAKRGKTKDIVVTVTTKTVNQKGESITKTASPLSMSRLKKGYNYEFRESVYPPFEIAKVSKVGDVIPVHVKFDILETGLGKGADLADKLTAAIVETLEKEKENIAKDVIGLVIKQPETPETPETPT